MSVEELAEQAFGVYKDSLDKARTQKLVIGWDNLTPSMKRAFIASTDYIVNEMIHAKGEALRSIAGIADAGDPMDSYRPYAAQRESSGEPPDTLADDNARFVTWGHGEAMRPEDVAVKIQELLRQKFEPSASGETWILMVRHG